MSRGIRTGTALAAALIGCQLLAPSAVHTQDRQCAFPEPLTEVPEPHDLASLHEISTGSGIDVAVIDTGVAEHPQLKEVVPGADFVVPEAPNPLFDCDGHGTIVAGIIAGRDFGIAPDARVISIRQTSGYYRSTETEGGREGDTHGSLETLASSIDDAVSRGADVINMSVVSCVSPTVAERIDDSSLRSALHRAEEKNVVVVAAAGNITDKCPMGSFVYPAHLPTVIPVGARETPYELADYSVVAPEVTAPAGQVKQLSAAGTPLVALSPRGEGFAAGIYPEGRGTAEEFSGTSFSAPVVSGIVALLRERYPESSAAHIRERIYAAAEPADGFVDPETALTMIDSDHQTLEHPVMVQAPENKASFAADRAGWIGLAAVVFAIALLAVIGIRRQRVTN